METRSLLANGIAILVLSVAPIAGLGCAVEAAPQGSLDEEPLASVSQAVDTDDPAFVRVVSNCTNPGGSANYVVDTGQIGSQGTSPAPEAGDCSSNAIFTINDVGETSGDVYNLSEAAEICGRLGFSGNYVKYFTPPASTCSPYANGTRRWVSYVGCCAAGTALPSQRVSLTQTNRDCNGNVVGSMLTPTFGSVTFTPNSTGQLVAQVSLQGAAPLTAYNVRVIQTPNDSGAECQAINGTITTDASGNASATFTEPLLATTTDAFVAINKVSDFNSFFTTADVTF